MRLIINGKEDLIEKDKLALAELLKLKGVENPEMVSVQLNGGFVVQDEFENTVLKEGDIVDFLYFMAGGILK